MPLRRNPFRQPQRQWQIRLRAHRDWVAAIDEAFADIALATLDFEIEEGNLEWCVDILTDVAPQEAGIEARLAKACAGDLIPPYEIQEVKDRAGLAKWNAAFLRCR